MLRVQDRPARLVEDEGIAPLGRPRPATRSAIPPSAHRPGHASDSQPAVPKPGQRSDLERVAGGWDSQPIGAMQPVLPMGTDILVEAGQRGMERDLPGPVEGELWAERSEWSQDVADSPGCDV